MRPEPDLAHQQELVDRQVGGENRPGPARLQLRETAHGILRDARGVQFRRYLSAGRSSSLLRLIPLHRPVPSYCSLIRILAAWRRCGSSDMTASVGPAWRCSDRANLAIAVPMLVARRCGRDGLPALGTPARAPASPWWRSTTPSAPSRRTSFSSCCLASCLASLTSSV